MILKMLEKLLLAGYITPMEPNLSIAEGNHPEVIADDLMKQQSHSHVAGHLSDQRSYRGVT